MSYLEHIKKLNSSKTFLVGDKVKVLIDYSLYPGTVVKVNKKTIKVCVIADFGCDDYTKNFVYEKVFKFGTQAALIWELWKGNNGRGGYRIETLLYPDLLQPIENIKPFGYLTEDSFGNLKQ